MTRFPLAALGHSLALDSSLLPPDVSLDGVVIDSHRLLADQLFVAIRGDTHDGHAFVPQAERAGAAAVVMDARGAQETASRPVPRPAGRAMQLGLRRTPRSMPAAALGPDGDSLDV